MPSGPPRPSTSSSLAGARIVVTGGSGFLGRAVLAQLAARGVTDPFVPRRREYDLTEREAVERLYRDARPDVVLHLAAEVGGIGANARSPGRYFYANMAMALHLIEEARRHGLRKFVQVGTICSYPKHTPVPFREEDLWNGYPEETNAPYGIAKKAALVMLDAYRRQYGLASACVLPVNLYGPWDNFDRETSHVIPALIRKCLEAVEAGAPSITCWGTGRASREFLFVDDAAEGVVAAAERVDDPDPINLGTSSEITIRDLTERIARLCGFEGSIAWDATRPDGQPRRAVDASRARERLGWIARTDLDEGLRRTVEWYRCNREHRSGYDPSVAGSH
ncbi:MAG: NAD-dependent epimerase/dehydratase family protein [Phycisphaera sp.]|nr:NAD-dependent epimerase/dehydratase family protein [Phycisphaera sp.]